MRHTSTIRSGKSKTVKKVPAKRASGKPAHFKVKAKPNSVVYIAGTFNGWDPSATVMTHEGDGYYSATLMLPVGRHEYKYVVDGDWCLDPSCDCCVANDLGSQNHWIEIC